MKDWYKTAQEVVKPQASRDVWYKEAQELQENQMQEINEHDSFFSQQRGVPSYVDIGHDAMDDIAWVYFHGSIVKTTGSHSFLRQRLGLDDNDFCRYYYGRFEVATRRLTIVRPVGRKTNIPTVVLDALQQTFNPINEIHTY